MKRILILISVASIVISLFAVTAFGADTTVNGYTVIDYNDYISDVKVDGDYDIVTVTLPDNMYSMTRSDIFGSDYKEGLSPWVLAVYYWINEPISAGVFCPSGAVNKRYLDLSNIPDGSIFTTTNRVELEPVADDSTGIFEIVYRSRIAYYDADFKLIKNQTSPAEELLYVPGEWEYEMKYEVAIKKPEGAKYCMTYFYFDVLSCPYNDAYTSYIYYEFAKPKLQMSISSLYRLQEQTGKTNQILGDIEDAITGDTDPVAPEGSDSIQGALDAENELKDKLNTDLALDEFQDAIHSVNNYLIHYGQGFYFLIVLMESFINIFWIKGLIMISISLGLFAFVTNVIQNIGSRAGKDKSNKRKGGSSG